MHTFKSSHSCASSCSIDGEPTNVRPHVNHEWAAWLTACQQLSAAAAAANSLQTALLLLLLLLLVVVVLSKVAPRRAGTNNQGLRWLGLAGPQPFHHFTL
jgi:hypothetical protein